MPSCFVSIPFGTKSIPDGRELDFDYLYHNVIKPAVEEVGFECDRLDEFSPGGIWQKQLFSAVISSDILIADLSSNNANVFYELGLRHALRRRRTILISAGGAASVVSILQALFYRPDEAGRLTGPPADEFRSQLQSMIRQSQHTTVNDSPVFDFFPDLEVNLPSELERVSRARGPRLKKQRQEFVQSVVESPDEAKRDLEESEAMFRGAPEVSPSAYLELMKRYRDLSEWDRVVGLADDAPPDVAGSPELRNMLALALNRRNGPGDQDRAISVMEQQIAETGGDSESFGILGRIYKDRYDQAKDQGDAAEASENLEKALKHYRKGFEKNPRDYYPGINVVNLLIQRGDEAAQQELSELVPRVSALLQEKLVGERVDFWDLATDLHLATVGRDWPRAEARAKLMMAQGPPRWMMETTLRDMRAVGKTFDNENDRSQLEKIIQLLQSPESEIGGAA